MDANSGGYGHGLAGDRLGVHVVAIDQRAGGGEREAAAGADADQAILGFQYVADPGQHQRRGRIDHRHHGFQAAQVAVGAPVLGQLDAGPGQLAGMGLELGFQALEQGEGIGRGTGEAGDHVALAEPAHLAGVRLHHGVAEADLTVPGDNRLIPLADRQNRGAVPGG